MPAIIPQAPQQTCHFTQNGDWHMDDQAVVKAIGATDQFLITVESLGGVSAQAVVDQLQKMYKVKKIYHLTRHVTVDTDTHDYYYTQVHHTSWVWYDGRQAIWETTTETGMLRYLKRYGHRNPLDTANYAEFRKQQILIVT